MFINLMPGIRQIRTPLATGYLWLLVVWFWVPSHYKSIAPNAGIPGDLVHLAHYGGRVAVGIAISFTAYLIGILSQFLNSPFAAVGALGDYLMIRRKSNRMIRPNIDPGLRREYRNILVSGQFSINGIANLEEYVNRAHRSYESNVGGGNAYNWTTYFSYIRQRTINHGNALVGKEPDLYSAYDRLVAEFEFRIGISVPLIALAVTLGARWTPIWLALLVPLLLLLTTGSRQRMTAGDLLADALRLERFKLSDPLHVDGEKATQGP